VDRGSFFSHLPVIAPTVSSAYFLSSRFGWFGVFGFPGCYWFSVESSHLYGHDVQPGMTHKQVSLAVIDSTICAQGANNQRFRRDHRWIGQARSKVSS
jgi:hypothetical protein